MKIKIKLNLLLLCMPLLVFFSCKHKASFRDKKAVIAIQPLNGFSKAHSSYVKAELETFFDKKIVVLPERTMPSEFVNYQKGKRFDAGKIIRWVSLLANDSFLSIAALTSEDIFTTKRDKSGLIKKPESSYAVWGIFGLGYCPGKSCVVSERRLLSRDDTKFRHRLRTVVIHEVGHNLGLPHCPNKGCIMSDANEKMATVDQSGDDYCNDCNRKIGRKS